MELTWMDRLWRLRAALLFVEHGHYVSIVISGGVWKKFDDDNVQILRERSVPSYLRNNTYGLVYGLFYDQVSWIYMIYHLNFVLLQKCAVKNTWTRLPSDFDGRIRKDSHASISDLNQSRIPETSKIWFLENITRLILDLPKKKLFWKRLHTCFCQKKGGNSFKIIFQLCVTLKTAEKSITIYFIFIRCLNQSRSPETSKIWFFEKCHEGSS